MPTSNQPPDITRIALVVRGRQGEYDVYMRRSTRARRIRLTVKPSGQIELVLPQRVATSAGLNFLHKHRQTLERFLEQLPEVKSLESFLREQGWVTVLGSRWSILWEREKEVSLRANQTQRSLTFALAGRQSHDEDLKYLLMSFARRCLPQRVRVLAERTGAKPVRISVRDQSSLWGSCSGRKTVSLNWRLLLIEPKLQDYVILHELAHLKHMNHSDAFWRHLTGMDPQTETHDRQLGLLAPQIMALGR